MTKRPSVVGGLKLPEPAPAPKRAASSKATISPPEEEAAPAGRRPRPDVVHSSVYLPKRVHRHLREIAFTRDVKVHDLILEGIDEVLRRHGHPGVAELKGSGKAS
jgi:hypothetical protein